MFLQVHVINQVCSDFGDSNGYKGNFCVQCAQFSALRKRNTFFYHTDHTMGKQFISTASVAQAHKLDIVCLAITNKYTVTVSTDGYAHFWDNKQEEGDEPRSKMHLELIHKLGVHHIASYENILPGSTKRVVVLAFVCYDGSIVLKTFENDDITTLEGVETNEFSKQYWAPAFYKDPESTQDYLIATKVSGETSVFKINVTREGDALKVAVEKHGDLISGNSFFAFSVAVTQAEDKKVAVGYSNGDVLLYDLVRLSPVYTFHSTDLQVTKNGRYHPIPRVLKFSPGGSILAVSRDNQSSGSITLYDVKYGENVGALTTPSHSSKTTVGGFAHDGWITGLSFDEDGKFLASCGFDKCIRVWNLDTREREATINISVTDLDNTEQDELDKSIVSDISFIKKGIRGGAGGDTNEGLCAISFDRGIRWYREAGGI